MAHLETRVFKARRFLLVLADTPEEEQILESITGKNHPVKIHGETAVSDGIGPLYLRLERGIQETPRGPKR